MSKVELTNDMVEKIACNVNQQNAMFRYCDVKLG